MLLFFGRYDDLPLPRDPDHVAVRIPDLRGRVRVPEEARHDVVVPVAFVVVGAFGVGEAKRAGGFEALVRDEGARDSEFELGFVVLKGGGSRAVDVWYGGDGLGVVASFFTVCSWDADPEAMVREAALEVDEGVCGHSHEAGGC